MPDFKMSYRYLLRAFLKAIIFVGLLLIVSFYLKLSFVQTPLYQKQQSSELDTNFYFIGTSRVQRSIAPDILKEALPAYNFINLGLSNNSFLYSCQAASNLLQQGADKKIIFIELTGLALPPSDSYYFLMSPRDVRTVIAQHLSIQCTREDISGLLFYMFSIHSDLKKIIYPKLNLYSFPELGYVGESREFNGSTSTILTPKSFAIKTEISPDLLNAYLANINRLKDLAKSKGGEIILILPLTLGKESEFNIDMSVFAQLPERNKWSYSNEFLASMCNAKYLSDISHLNKAGSQVYTLELLKFITERFDLAH